MVQPKAAQIKHQVNSVMQLIVCANATRLLVPVAEQQTHVLTSAALAEGVTLAKYGVKRVSLVFVSVESMTPVKETYMENIVTHRIACANAHLTLMRVVEIDPNV